MKVAPDAPHRPALRFYGAKWLLARWILTHFPAHECYVEPFGGSAAVLLQKPRSWLEVYNDKDREVVNFFRALREHPADLIRAIELTPYSKVEWELAQQDDPDPIESARRFYVRAYQNIAGATAQWKSGWRRQKVVSKKNGKKAMTPASVSFMGTEHLYQIVARFRGVQLECDEAENVMERYDSPETLFYLDPPYPSSTRGRWKKHAYSHEMTDEQHSELSRAAHAACGCVLISGYRCELYDRLYADWKRYDQVARVNGPGSATESLWVSPHADQSLQMPRQAQLC